MAGYIGTKAVSLSTTAASVTGNADIGGNLTVDTSTLFVDSTNNFVGFGTTTAPSASTIKGVFAGNGAYTQWTRTSTTIAGSYAGTDGNGLVFGTHTGNVGAETYTERMRLNASGNVGIGTSSPLAALHVATSTTDYTGDVVISGTRPYLVFDDTTVGQNGFSIGVDGGAVTFGQGDFSTNSNVYGTERMRIDASGNLLVGTTSTNLASGALYLVPGTNAELGIGHASAASSGSTFVAFRHNNTGIGSITQSGTTGVSYNTSSDYRLKEDWQPMTGASERVLALKPVNFAWKADGTRVDGFLAHEAQEIVPEAVHGVKDGMRIEEYEVTPAVYDDEGNLVSEAVMGTREVPDYQGIDQSKLVPLLTAALQEALGRIETLEADVAALKGATNV